MIVYRKQMAADEYQHQSLRVVAVCGRSETAYAHPARVYVGTKVDSRTDFLGAHLSTAQARKLARWLLKAADKAEAVSD